MFDPGSKRVQSSLEKRRGGLVGDRKEGVKGWVVNVGGASGLKVAPWVVLERKRNLFYSLISFMVSKKGGSCENRTMVVEMLG